MTRPAHHPTDDHLLAYASGAMESVKAVLVATHLAWCPECRERVARFEEACGGWLEALPPEPLAAAADDDALAALLDRLDARRPVAVPGAAPVPAPGAVPAAAALHNPAVPEPLRSRLGGPVAAFAWTPVSEGVDLSQWSVADDTSSVCLLRMAAGRPVPAHHHTAEEMLLVLEGAFSDEYGRFAVGDVAVYVPDSDHHATADADGTCLCLFLLDGPIEFLAD